ncbi:hypothetical protein NDU88_002024 [Pleurodeles waltl]|uniref:Uncharacterized protein n=1 Tax=Pleurodeles waltl TaxID=8319 RepID=A0AAV7RDA8_PLEWA|nr:hypothetical protein NDU88_002024 [Pleurodeles waltl]
MVKPKSHPHAQLNKMDKYTVAKQPVPSAADGEPPGEAEPSLGAIMEAIQDLKSSLELKLDAVMLDVNLLRADFHNMVAKVQSIPTTSDQNPAQDWGKHRDGHREEESVPAGTELRQSGAKE